MITSSANPSPPSSSTRAPVSDLLIWSALGIGMVLGVGSAVSLRWLLLSHESLAQTIANARAVLAGMSVVLVLVLGMLPFLESGPTVRFLRGVRGLWQDARAAVLNPQSRRWINVLAFGTITLVSYTTWTAIMGFFAHELDSVAPAADVAWGWPLGGLLFAGVLAIVVEKRSR